MAKVDIMTDLKSTILDIWNENVFTHESSIKWFENLKVVLSDFFDISSAELFYI